MWDFQYLYQSLRPCSPWSEDASSHWSVPSCLWSHMKASLLSSVRKRAGWLLVGSQQAAASHPRTIWLMLMCTVSSMLAVKSWKEEQWQHREGDGLLGITSVSLW